MSDPTEVNLLEGTFLVSPSAKRRKLVAEMVADLELREPEGAHFLAAGFIEKGRADYFHVHIDRAEPVRKAKSPRATSDYFVTIALRERPKSEPPRDIRNRRHGIGWAMDKMGEFLAGGDTTSFLDAQLTMRNRERPSVVRPLVVDEEVVPAIGAEYATARTERGLRRLRWSMTSPSDKTMSVSISYVLAFDGSKPFGQWLAESQAILVSTAERAFPNA